MAAIGLITLDDAKEHLNIPLTDTRFDNLINKKILAVTEFAENYCNRCFIKTSRTEVLYVQNGIAFTRQIPILTITSITDLVNNILVDLSTLSIDEDIGKISGLETTKIKIVYNSGLFETVADVSEDLKEFCRRKLAEMFTFRTSGSDTEKYGNIELKRTIGINEDDLIVLNKYRIIPI